MILLVMVSMQQVKKLWKRLITLMVTVLIGKKELQKELNKKYARPIEIRSDNIAHKGPQLFADGVPSLMMVMAPLGVAKTLGYTFQRC